MRGLTVNDMDFQQRDPDRPGEAGIRIRTFIEGRDGTFLGRTVESSAGPDELGAGSNFQNGREFSARRTVASIDVVSGVFARRRGGGS
jgi:hypothetical protein